MIKPNILFLNKFLNSELLKNTSILVSGTVLAQLIPILLQPILRRHYSPEAFGSFAVYISMVGILIVIASFKYELAIILPKKDKEAANLLFLAVILNLLFNGILFLIILWWKFSIVEFLNISKEFHNYIYFVPIGSFLYSFYQSLNYWFIRKKRFYVISQNKFTRRGIEGTTQIGFQFISETYGLIIGDIIGHVANIISGLYFCFKSGFKFTLISIKKIKYIFTKYIEYPKFNVIPSVMSACSYLFPTLIINKYFSLEYTGYFDLSKQMLSIPFALIATSISNVLLQSISVKYRNKESFLKELYPILFFVLLITTIEILIIVFFGEYLFKVVFGEEWIFSGQISKILVWSYAFNFFIASFSSIFLAMKKIKLLSIWQLFYFMSILLLLFFKKYSFIEFLKIYVVIEVICYAAMAIVLVLIIKQFEKQVRFD